MSFLTYPDFGLKTATASSRSNSFLPILTVLEIASFLYLKQPMPSLSLSNPWGSGSSARKRRWEMSPQFRSGGAGGMHTSG